MGKLKEKVPSPCINICTPDDATNLCKGCFRTADEIANWLYYSDDEKKNILVLIKSRRINDKLE